MRFFPVSYDVAGRAVILVGGGEEALVKLRLLLRTEGRPVVFAAHASPELMALAGQHGVTVHPREPGIGDLSGAALLFIATGDEARDRALAALGRQAGVPVNVVDRLELCDFAVPAIVDRAPVSVAIATDGLAPVLAQRVRAAVEALLAPEFGRLGELARSVRDSVGEALAGNARRRRFWTSLFDGRGAELALAGDLEGARRAALSELAQAEGQDGEGVVWLIGAGPGAEDLLTLRAQRLLQRADVIVHDQLVPDAVVEMGRRDAARIGVGKAKGKHSVTQGAINDLLVKLAREGKHVARLKAGDPLVFGRAGEEIAALRQAGIRYTVVPGVTAALAAAADYAVPLTLRGVSSSLVFASGHGANGTEPKGWPEVARAGGTIGVYMGRTAAVETYERLVGNGVAPSTPVAAIENAGRADSRAFFGRLADLPGLAERVDVAGPVLILVGDAVAAGDFGAAGPIAQRTEASASLLAAE
nr:siroheme synthase CysG [Pseudochelatococcus lubricantis]